MKRSLSILLILLTFSSVGMAQTDEATIKNKEIGIRLTELTDFGFIYKKQRTENKYCRMRLVLAQAQITEFDSIVGKFNLGVAFGREKRKPINDHFKFICGWEFMLNGQTDVNGSYTKLNIVPGLGMVLGFRYDVNSHFGIDLETIPSVAANIQYDNVTQKTELQQLSVGFNSNAVALGLMYKF